MTTETAKNIGDVVVGAAIFASVMQWLPAIAAGLGIVYTAMRIFMEWPKLVERVKEILRG